MENKGKSLDWQLDTRNVCERNKYLLETGFLSDISFIVGEYQERLLAHKLILSSASPVFSSMLNGHFVDSQESEITIPDVSPPAFKIMLKYVYTDVVELQVQSVSAALYCSEKYGLPHLKESCIEFIQANNSASNACLLYSLSRQYLVSDFVPILRRSIVLNAEESLSSESFVEIDKDTLEDILSCDDLNCEEVVVFLSAIKWASARLKKEDISGQLLRATLGPAFDLIRFANLTPSDFVNQVLPSGILENDEVLRILKDISEKKNISHRKVLIQVCDRFGSKIKVNTSVTHHSIRFKVSKAIKIHGYGLFSNANKGAKFSGKISLDSLNPKGRLAQDEFEMITSTDFTTISSYYFNEPISICSDTYYSASLTINHAKEEQYYYCGLNGREKVVVDGVEFSFKDSPGIDNDDTCVEEGQIPLIYFRNSVV